jgi:LPS-assembly lipoprotein
MITRRRLLGLSLALPALSALLGGCGWEPLYADRQAIPANADLRAIKVIPIAERVGQRLERGLRDSFNPTNEPTPAKYELRVALRTTAVDLGIQSQGLGTRGEVQVTATYTLSDIATHAPLQTGVVHASDSFDIQANGYSTVVAQNDAYVRTGEEIRREIVTRMTLLMQKRESGAS